MRKSIIVAGLVLGGLAVAGGASALAPGGCQFGNSPLGFYEVCLIGASGTNTYWDNFVYSSGPAGGVSAGAYQSSFDAPGCCNGQTTGANAAFFGPGGYAYVGAYNYNYDYPCCGFSFGGTGAYASTSAGYVSAGQYSGTGYCENYLFTPFGGQFQPCGPVPVIPAAPFVPVPL